MICGAAPGWIADLALRAEERIGAPIRRLLGMTEFEPGQSRESANSKLPRRRRAVSDRCCPTPRRAWLIPTPTRTHGRGEDGEVWIRGPQVMRGTGTGRRRRRRRWSPDGWLRTGDIAQAGDDNGGFYLVDRLKELIEGKAYQVLPAELEAILVTHPQITDAGVIGIPDAEAVRCRGLRRRRGPAC